MALYKPGKEPEKIKAKLKTFFARLDEYYPDKKVIGLHNEHKKLGERLTALYRELGYASGAEMLEAYGYTPLQKVKTAKTDEQKADEKAKLIKKLKNLMNGEAACKSINELKRTFPDLAKDITNTSLTKQELVNAGVLMNAEKLSDKQLRDLKEIVKKKGEGMTFTSMSAISRKLPETENLVRNLRKMENINTILHDAGILSAKQKKTKEKPKTTITSRSVSFYRQEYGFSRAEFKDRCYDIAPKGRLGSALKLIDKALNDVDQVWNEIPLKDQMFSESTIKDLQAAAAQAGYISAKRLLKDHGYEVADVQSGLTAIVTIADDDPPEKDQRESISYIRSQPMLCASMLPVVTKVDSFEEKTFVLTGDFSDYYYDSLHKIIPQKGGRVTSTVSGKTDYVIVLCRGMQEIPRKILDAAKQCEYKNHTIQLIFFEDIADSLGIKLDPNEMRNFTEFKTNNPDYMTIYKKEHNEKSFTPVLSGKYDIG